MCQPDTVQSYEDDTVLVHKHKTPLAPALIIILLMSLAYRRIL